MYQVLSVDMEQNPYKPNVEKNNQGPSFTKFTD